MIRIKIRTVVAALAASFSLAGVVAPLAAQAEPNSSGATSSACDNLYGQFEHWVNLADGLYKSEGNGGTFKAVLDAAESTLHEAQNQGCDWAGSAQAAITHLHVAATTIGGLHLAAPVSVGAPTKVTKLTVTTLPVS
jgi:hypothetical protein